MKMASLLDRPLLEHLVTTADIVQRVLEKDVTYKM